MIENRQVIDRAWPAEEKMSREDRIDELTRDAMFRAWDFVATLSDREAKELLGRVIYGCWRGKERPDNERLAEIKRDVEDFIDDWAERAAGEEE